MSVIYRDEFFEYLQGKYEFLVDLSIGNVYPLFFSSYTKEEFHDSHCNSLTTSKNSNICDHRSLCISAQNALTHLHGMILAKYVQNSSKWCEYLSYSIHTSILNSKTCNHTEQLYNQLEEIITNYYTLSNYCTIQEFTIDMEDFMKKKKLYLLGEILFWIKNEYEENIYLNKYTYDEFFGECSTIYKQIITEDECKINANYDKELINLKENFNSTKAYLIKKYKSITHDDLQLPNESMCQQDIKDVHAGSEGPQIIQAQQEKQGEDESLEEKQAGITSPRVQGLGGVSLSGARITGEGLGTEAAATLSVAQIDVEGKDGESSDENTSNPLGTIVGTSLGFILPLITMYKFTPLGTWINTKILGRNNIMKNIKNNNQDFLLNSSENREMELGDTMYRVAYNSVTK